MNQKEATLRQQVHTLIVSPPENLVDVHNAWLKRQKMTVEKYAKTTMSSSKQVDGFFFLCVACKFATHMALIHLDRIWSTHLDRLLQVGNLMLVQTTDGFREVLKIKDDIELYDTLGNALCLDSFWTSQPPCFTVPVEDLLERAEDAGYKIQPGQKLCSIKEILSKLMGMSLNSYQYFMRCWFCDFFHNHWIATQWWQQRNLTWSLYQAILDTQVDADGLEVLVASAAMWMHLNILQ